MKPMAPVTEVTAPTASAVPATTSAAGGARLTPRLCACASPSDSASSALPVSASSAPPADDERQDQQHLAPALVGQRAQQPVHDLIGGIGIGREVQRQRDAGGRQAGNRRARQHQRHGAAAAQARRSARRRPARPTMPSSGPATGDSAVKPK